VLIPIEVGHGDRERARSQSERRSGGGGEASSAAVQENAHAGAPVAEHEIQASIEIPVDERLDSVCRWQRECRAARSPETAVASAQMDDDPSPDRAR
jgi:hypothetical protein